MPGSPLDLQYPATSDSTYDVLAKFAENFQVLETDLEAKVNEADIQIGGALSLYDHPLTDVGSLVMSPITSASPTAGTLTYANGSWYLADDVGAIQLTDGAGGINAAGIGGIGGDYGGSDPAEMTYDAAGGAYSLTDDPGVYSDLKLEKVLLQRAAGSLSISAVSGITGAQAITIAAPPGSGTGMLTLTSAGVLAADAAVTNAQTFSDLTVTDLTATNVYRPSAVRAVNLGHLEPVSPGTFTRQLGRITTASLDCRFLVPIELAVGEKVTSISCHINRTGAGTAKLRAYRVSTAGTVTYLGAEETSTSTGSVTMTFAYAGAACAANETFEAYLELPNVGDYVNAVLITRETTP